VITTATALGMGEVLDLLDTYATAAQSVAEVDVELTVPAPTLDEAVERVLVWTVLGDRALIALRRLAHEVIAVRRI
jgi:hypothetical protein